MWEFKNFIFGFGLSLVGVSLTSHLLASSAHISHVYPSHSSIQIELFKSDNTAFKNISFAEIQKNSLLDIHPSQDNMSSSSQSSEIKLAELPSTKNEISSENSDIIYSPQEIDGPEDDEILSVNIDNSIPIDFEKQQNYSYDAEVSYSGDTDNQIALLPTDTSVDNIDNSFDSPWVVAQGSKHIKNKKLLEQYASDNTNSLFDDTPEQLANNTEDLSYKVAERIKQSIIFPIPDEILNDENLTPTFIANKPQTTTIKKEKSQTSKKKSSPEPLAVPQEDNSSLKIISKKIPDTKPTSTTPKESKSILSNISSWFSPSDSRKEVSTPAQPKSKIKPSYSSQGEQSNTATLSSNDALVSFYETIQETQKEQAQNKIIPSELKLSFQPDRAEISGQTLRWLKAFSEKAKERHYYLQIRLDATASIELQRKRLNLLYTIFANNGVDFKKVDTVFSLTEPNTFIIRTIKIQE